ncbi:hypothetical protein P879_02602 [Paragonimus westermani]|uniref:G-protein coupled receptors family 2 profile 2 domain-containing protein n=1 Tax=Paragonimus westermani TaxID=34504 RepID=A0A8T0DY43_9TREM|nr:hypothetical protein P879_02602 [Paragonimus westermani]
MSSENFRPRWSSFPICVVKHEPSTRSSSRLECSGIHFTHLNISNVWSVKFKFKTTSDFKALLFQVDSTIYDLTEEESISIIEEIEKECAQNRSREELSIYDRSQLCLSNFSSTVCWPTTPAGQNAVVPCPYYVSGVRMGGVAVRSCNVTTVLPKMDITNQTKVIWEFSPPDFTDCLSASQSDHVEILVTIGTAGYAISTLSLICAITIMIKFRRLHCPRNTIHINLFAAILFRCIVHFVQTIYTTGQVDWQIKWLCRTLSALTNFTVVATYSWVFIEALFLHNTVLMNVMNESIISVIFYITMGWILPLLITVIWVILRSTVTTGAICWIVDSSPNSPSRLLVVLFPVIVILLNIAFFINILRVIWGKLNSQSSNEASRLRQVREYHFPQVHYIQ